jgi:hypothetical protein
MGTFKYFSGADFAYKSIGYEPYGGRKVGKGGRKVGSGK